MGFFAIIEAYGYPDNPDLQIEVSVDLDYSYIRIRNMLPSQYRLRKMKDIDILFKEGRFVGGELVTLKLWWIDPEKYPRRAYTRNDLKIGFVVGKKVSKSAVKRNRIKRQMREVVRLLIKDGKIKDGVMVSIIAKPNSLGATYHALEEDILNVFRRAKLLK